MKIIPVSMNTVPVNICGNSVCEANITFNMRLKLKFDVKLNVRFDVRFNIRFVAWYYFERLNMNRFRGIFSFKANRIR